jgi:peptidoglycan/xylan/chitin deacetylase (PgdA/CDA1 family)
MGRSLPEDIFMDRSRRRILLGAGAALAVTGVGGRAAGQGIETRLPGRGVVTSGMQATFTRVATAEPMVALTFDDGPHPRLTPQYLDVMRILEVPATFYVLGGRVAQAPRLTARIAEEGHEIGNHTWSHPNLAQLSDDQVLRQVDATSRAVIEATGRMPVTLRPPWGELSPRQRLMVFRSRGMPSVFWSVDTEDWRRPGATVVAARMRAALPGDVVLGHDTHAQVLRALPSAVEGLRARGFRFVTVSELIGWPSWHSRRLRAELPARRG